MEHLDLEDQLADAKMEHLEVVLEPCQAMSHATTRSTISSIDQLQHVGVGWEKYFAM